MKVLQINTVTGTGSTGRIAEDILETVLAHGDEGIIACGINNTSKRFADKVYKIGGRINVRLFHAAISRITDRAGFYSTYSTKRLINYIKQERFDIIHLHNLHGYYINISVLFEELAKMPVKVIWTFHDCWPMTGHCTYFDYIGCEKWKDKCEKCPQKNKYPKSIGLDNSTRNYLDKKRLFNSIDYTIVTPSNWLNNLCKESYLSSKPICTIYNGVDLTKFYPRDAYQLKKSYGIDDKFIIIAVSAGWDMREMDDRKGIKDILELRKQLDDSYAIVLIGFKDELSMKDLPKGITGVLKTKDLDELAEWYSAGDIFINPTREEVLGMVNIEALACGTPVITYNTGGSPETIDKSCGMIIEKGNITALRESIINCRNNNFLEASCVNRAKIFNKKVCYERYYELYQQMNLQSK